MKRIQKVYDFIVTKRVLDGYIGLFGVIIWCHVLAQYHSTIEILYLSARAWKWSLFHISLEHHPHNKTNCSYSFYPPLTFELKVGPWTAVDTSATAARLTSESVGIIMAESRKQKTEEARLVKAAREAGL